MSKFPTCFPYKTGLLSVSIHLIMIERPIIFRHLDHAGSVATSCSRVPAVPTSPCKKVWSQWLYAICKTFQIISSDNCDFQILDLRRNHIFRISFCKESCSTGTLSSRQLRAPQFIVSLPEGIPLDHKSLKQDKKVHSHHKTDYHKRSYLQGNTNSLASETSILWCSH